MQASTVVEYDDVGHRHTHALSDWKLGENAHPIRDRVIIQRREPDICYEGTTIQVPDKSKAKSPWCEVISVGPEVSEVSPGDTVVVNTWAGEPIHHDELPRLFVVLEEDIEGVFENE